MSAEVRCRLIEVELSPWREERGHKTRFLMDKATGARPQPGDMWYDREPGRRQLSDYYREHNSHRPPLWVVLPTGTHFLIDSSYYDQERGAHGGWTVTGEAPAITMTPSINAVGIWHGFLTAGVLKTA